MESNSTLTVLDSYLPPRRRAWFLAGFFLVVWPTFNVLFTSLVALELGNFDGGLLRAMSVRFYSCFAIAYLLIQLLQHGFPGHFPEEKFWPQLALHALVVLLVNLFVLPALPDSPLDGPPTVSTLPVVFMAFQVTLYVVVKTLMIQREQYLAAQLYLRQAQVNLLRSQSNPHFLFNTLNLLASEISRNPENAREIIFDLSDLLRESMQAAEREFISLQEEVRLARLYLVLQQKRFPERLKFEILVEDNVRHAQVPSLLLQPIVENVVKHVVSHSAEMTSLRLEATASDTSLFICVKDSGREKMASKVAPSGGLRIVRETLELHYQKAAQMRINSDQGGTQISITIPLSQVNKGS